MLEYNEIRERRYIVLDGDPYEVLDSHIARKQQRKPTNQTKLRNLLNGSVRQETFHATDTVQEAVIEKRKVIFAFTKENRQTGKTELWFTDENDKSKRFEISADIIGDKRKYMKENGTVDALFFDDLVIGVALPIKVELKVTESAPAVKGNSATGASKTVIVETGAQITTPLFINEGDTLVINTETGEYVERGK